MVNSCINFSCANNSRVCGCTQVFNAAFNARPDFHAAGNTFPASARCVNLIQCFVSTPAPRHAGKIIGSPECVNEEKFEREREREREGACNKSLCEGYLDYQRVRFGRGYIRDTKEKPTLLRAFASRCSFTVRRNICPSAIFVRGATNV